MYMNKNIIRIVQILLGVFLAAHNSEEADCYKEVATCPCTGGQWMERSINSTCRLPKRYACVLHANFILVEICTTDFKILKGNSGCPYVKTCNEKGEAEFGLQSKYEKCPQNVEGCPNNAHPEYSIHKMYLYPACFITKRNDIENTTFDEYCTKEQDTNIPNLPTSGMDVKMIVIIVLVAVVLLLVGPAAYYCGSRFPWLVPGVPDVEMDSSQIHERAGLLDVNAEENTQTQEGEGRQDTRRNSEDFINLKRRLLQMNESEVKNCKRTHPLYRSFNLPEGSNYFASLTLEDNVDYIVNGNRSDDDDIKRIPSKDTQSPEDLFVKSDILRYLFLRGEAGSGKTTFCTRLLDYWCKAQSHSVRVLGPEEKHEKDDEEKKWISFFKRFDFAFIVRFRDVSKDLSSVIEMICQDHNFVHESGFHDQIRQVVCNAEHKCIIILDGLDEWTPSEDAFFRLQTSGMPNFDVTSSNVVLISSRPWKLDMICECMRERDRMVDIKGLDIEGMKTIFENIFLHHYKGEKEKLIDEFERFRKKCPHSFHLNPFHLTASIHLLHKNEEISGSKTHFFLSLIEFLFKRKHAQNIVDNKSTEKNVAFEMKVTLKGYKLIQSKISVLTKLGEIAYDDLVAKDTHLVFEEDKIREKIEEDYLNLVRNVGLLIDSASADGIVRVRFMHNIIQQLLAAIFVNSKPSSFLERLSNVQGIFELNYFLIFISGLSLQQFEEISKRITEIANEAEDIIAYRATFEYEKHHITRRLYNLLLDCFKEVTESAMPASTCVASDIYLRSEDKKDEIHFHENVSLTKRILRGSVAEVRSLYLRSISNKDDDEGIPDCILKYFLQRNPQLESIYIKGVDGDRSFQSADIFDIAKKKAFLLDDVTITNDTLMGLQKKISQAQQLQTLGLWNIRYSVSNEGPSRAMQKLLQTLPKVQTLTTLYFSCSTNKQDRALFIGALPAFQHLEIIQYGGDRNNREKDTMDNDVVREILKSHAKGLKKFLLNYLELEVDTLDELKELACIERMELREVKIEERGWENILKNMENIQPAFKVAFIGTDFPISMRERVSGNSAFKRMSGDPHLNCGKNDTFCFERVCKSSLILNL